MPVNDNNSQDVDLDVFFIRLIRPHLGKPWDEVKARLIAQLPDDVDPALLAKYVDDSPRPSVNVNAYGVEPRFYAHRDSRRLLEFYRSKE